MTTDHLPTPNYPRFHLAFPVTDLDEARRFYGELLGCAEGRSSPDWVDFDFHGHQIVAHKVARAEMGEATSDVDGKSVPVRHFGVILDLSTWEGLAERLRSAGVEFVVEPYVRFRGLPGEQATMFFLDPFGNALEFKACRTYLIISRGMRCGQTARPQGARRRRSSAYATTSNAAAGPFGRNPEGRGPRGRISALLVACLGRPNGAPRALNCGPGDPVAPVADDEIGSVDIDRLFAKQP